MKHGEMVAHSKGGVIAWFHTFEPRPSTIHLQILQFLLGLGDSGVEQVRVEELAELVALFGLVLRVEHPRRLLQQDVLQLLVFLQLTLQGGLLPRLALPLADEPHQLRHAGCKVFCHGVDIERPRPVDGAVVFWIHHRMERHHHIPRRRVGVVEHHLALYGGRRVVVEERGDVHLLGSRPLDIERHGLRDEFLVGEHRQPVALTVGSSAVGSRDLAHEHVESVRHIVRERCVGGFSRLHGEASLLTEHLLVGPWVDEPHGGSACHRFLTLVDDTCGHRGLVAGADEARHVRLHHEVLRRHCRSLKHSMIHLARMCKRHEAPLGQALRQGEGNSHHAVLVGEQVRIEERRLLKVGAHRRLRSFLRFSTVLLSCIRQFILLHRGFGHRSFRNCHHIHHRRSFIQHIHLDSLFHHHTSALLHHRAAHR